MSFDQQVKRVLLKRENPPKLQYIELEHLSSLVGSHYQVDGYHLCNLHMVEEDEGFIFELSTHSFHPTGSQENQLESLLADYPDLFQEPKGLPPLRSQNPSKRWWRIG